MNKRIPITLFLGLLISFTVATIPADAQRRNSGQTDYFPEPGRWEFRSPEAVGMDSSLLQQAVHYAMEQATDAPADLKLAHYESPFGREPFSDPIGPLPERGPCTGLIIRHGYIVAAWGDPGRSDLTFSVAKSFLSTVVGLAVEKGLIRDVNDLVYPYMAPIVPYRPYLAAMDKSDALREEDVIDLFSTEHNRKITWDHMLRQTSDWEGTLWGKPDWADRPEGDSKTWTTRDRHEPGTVYKYNDTRVNVLALAALNVWRRPLPEVLKQYIMDPIGASATWRWTGYNNSWVLMDGTLMQSVSGGSHWGGGLFINAYDQARFGYLTLRNGRWKDRQLIPVSWLRLARTPTPVQPTYGFMNFFLNTNRKLFPEAPESVFAHLGAGTNMIYVDPENDLVIVARWVKNDALAGIVDRVLQSIKP